MRVKASEAIGQALGLWRGMDPRRRLVLVAASVTVLALLAGWTYLAGRPEFVVLYNRLDASDASSIVGVLEGKGTAYRLADGGAAILVPSRDVHATRLALAGEGLPSQGSPGFELLEGISIGATEFERRAAYVRALSGELARTIGQISQVESARVHVPQYDRCDRRKHDGGRAVGQRKLPRKPAGCIRAGRGRSDRVHVRIAQQGAQS